MILFLLLKYSHKALWLVHHFQACTYPRYLFDIANFAPFKIQKKMAYKRYIHMHTVFKEILKTPTH